MDLTKIKSIKELRDIQMNGILGLSEEHLYLFDPKFQTYNRYMTLVSLNLSDKSYWKNLLEKYIKQGRLYKKGEE